MPSVNRQSPNGPTKTRPEGVLSRVQAVDDIPETGVKFNVYGRSKMGKTRFSATFPKPLLILGTEDGTKSIRTIPGIDFVRVNSSVELEELIDYMKQGGGSGWKNSKSGLAKVPMGEGDPYASASLDHAGNYQDMVLKEVLGLDDMPVQKNWGMADQGTWGVIAQQFKERVNKLLNLADTHGTNVVIIAHERSFGDDQSNSEEMLVPTIASALTPKIATWLNGVMDFIGNCFVRNKVIIKKTKQGEGKQARVVETRITTNQKEYCLRVGPHRHYITGFRLPPEVLLPDVLVDPHFEDVAKLIRGEPLQEA